MDSFDRICCEAEESQDEHATAHGAGKRLGTNVCGLGVYVARDEQALKAAGYEFARWRMRSGRPSVWGWA